MNIIKKTGTTNTTILQNRKIEYLVIHYTAGTRSSKGNAQNLANWFNNSSAQASADFIVDDEEVVQYNPDPKNRYCWAVGGLKYTTLSTSEGGLYYNKANNKNCISIEMCSSKKYTSTLNATDTDWYFTDAVLRNGIELAKYLMKLYDIDIDHVIMHHHITGKICPNPFCVNEKALKNWVKFKSMLIDNTNATVNSNCNVFEQPNTWCNPVTELKKGCRITFKDDCNNGWSKVLYNGKAGYMKNSKFTKDDGGKLSDYPQRKITIDCRLRSSREIDKNIIYDLKIGDKFILLGKDDKWVYCEYNGQKGYILKSKTNVK